MFHLTDISGDTRICIGGGAANGAGSVIIIISGEGVIA